jgi:S-(hydroxymethyl)glutathione dehydrogenase/alcohol dehydrogenase
MKIKAAILERLDSPLVIREIESMPLERGQILVRIFYSGVCRSQLMEQRGKRGDDRWLPHLLGHEGSGVVLDIGPDVTKFKSGDEVILGWIVAEGIAGKGAQYRYGDQIINSGAVTTFSNYSVVSENRLTKKPVGLPFDEAVLYGCALPTGAGLVLNEVKPRLDESVVVLGLGGIGLSALFSLKAMGVKNIIALDSSDEKILFAKKIGCDQSFNTQSGDIEGLVAGLTGGGADICIESAGQVLTIELGFKLIKKNGGKLFFASHPPQGEFIKINPHDLISGKLIFGTWGGATKPDRDIPKICSLINGGSTSIRNLISKKYKLEDINLALNDLDAGKVFRPLIEMNH